MAYLLNVFSTSSPHLFTCTPKVNINYFVQMFTKRYAIGSIPAFCALFTIFISEIERQAIDYEIAVSVGGDITRCEHEEARMLIICCRVRIGY
jgi:hypothetical protein